MSNHSVRGGRTYSRDKAGGRGRRQRHEAGVDVHSNDDLGNLNLTDDGIKKRDEIVCEYFKEKKIPLCTVIGGGYSKNRQELASRHFSIFETVSKTYL